MTNSARSVATIATTQAIRVAAAAKSIAPTLNVVVMAKSVGSVAELRAVQVTNIASPLPVGERAVVLRAKYGETLTADVATAYVEDDVAAKEKLVSVEPGKRSAVFPMWSPAEESAAKRAKSATTQLTSAAHRAR